MDQFDPKDPKEIVPLTFDFSSFLDGGQKISGTPVVDVTVYAGVDPSPTAILSGAVSVIGDRVRQNATAGIAGTDYLVRVTATTTTGLKYTIGRVLPVRLAGTY